ncbi:MAG: molecular chaperone DnaJ [Candidatus Hydrogenedentes bacterium CG07_land_8_20_14_0_80_42_17]|nr:MAG: molecular chaperone DnaJ [Candidatus Hydrogenedentes bacterium CG1_02_42_14]PIU46522.1 MAG: molecular chaperone DnaJ [Candidatus Hydrogenedentes bacterium CG07_land_8_20_14_0_80_42_17]
MPRDYYEILGVNKDASIDEIKKEYRRLAMRYHPDKNPGNKEAEEKFKEISTAYAILSDPEKRAQYDRFGHSAFEQRSAGGAYTQVDPFDLFKSIFGGGGFGGSVFDDFLGGMGGGFRRSESIRGDDLRTSVTLDFDAAARGAEVNLKITRLETCGTCSGSGAKPGTSSVKCSTCDGHGQVRQTQQTFFGHFSTVETCSKCQGRGQVLKEPCPDCKGEGREEVKRNLDVKIPAGIEDESILRLRGEGDVGPRNGTPGDLHVVIRVRPHSIFEREGLNLICKVPVTYSQLVLGSEIEVPTLKKGAGGKTLKSKIKIPAGTDTNTIFRVKGYGLPDLHNPKRIGDLLVRVEIEIPSRISKREKELLVELQALKSESNVKVKGFFQKVSDLFGS